MFPRERTKENKIVTIHSKALKIQSNDVSFNPTSNITELWLGTKTFNLWLINLSVADRLSSNYPSVVLYTLDKF